MPVTMAVPVPESPTDAADLPVLFVVPVLLLVVVPVLILRTLDPAPVADRSAS